MGEMWQCRTCEGKFVMSANKDIRVARAVSLTGEQFSNGFYYVCLTDFSSAGACIVKEKTPEIMNQTIYDCDGCYRSLKPYHFAKIVTSVSENDAVLCYSCWVMYKRSPDYLTFKTFLDMRRS